MKTIRETRRLLSMDLARLAGRDSRTKALRYLITNHSYQILFFFRWIQYLKVTRIKLLKLALLVFVPAYKFVQHWTGIQLPSCTHVGGGLLFAHFSCIVINGGTSIGENCTIFQGVTIGSARGKGAPHIGNNVVLAAGAKVIGNIRIEDNVFVGANAVATKSLPQNCVAAGVPAKVLNYNGRESVELYR